MSKNYARMSAAVAMTLSSAVTQAQDYHKGIYLGINTGASFVTGQTYDRLSASPDLLQNSGNVAVFGSTIFRDEASARGYNGGAMLGWGFYCDNTFVYSVEVSGNIYSNRGYQDLWSTAVVTNDLPPEIGGLNLEESWDLTYSAELVFKPGYLISNSTQLFGIIGGSVAGLNTRIKNLTPNTAFGNPTTVEDSKTIYGLVLGAGLEKQISNNFSVLASYEYTYYGRAGLDRAIVGPTGEFDFRTFVDRDIRIDTNVFKIGITYTFLV